MGDKKDILFVFYTLAAGGAEKTVINVANYLAEKLDYKITFYVYDNSVGLSSLISKNIKVLGANHSTVFSSSAEEYYSKYLKFGRSLAANVSPGDFDFIISVHQQLPEISVIYLFLKNLFKPGKSKYVSMIHTSPRIYRLYHRSFLSRIVQLFLLVFRRFVYDYTIAVSDQISSDIKNYPRNKIKIIYNALNIDEIKILSKQQLSARINEYEKSGYLLNPARITGPKNQILLIYAFNLVKDKLSQKLLLLGHNNDKKYFDSVIKLIKDLNLEDRVIYIGTDSNPYPYIKCACAVILSSNYESFSLALHEAMVLKTPVITTKFYGYEEFLNNDNCITADAAPEALAEAMLFVIQNAGKNVTMLENAYSHAMKFDSQKIAEQYHQFFNGYNV